MNVVLAVGAAHVFAFEIRNVPTVTLVILAGVAPLPQLLVAVVTVTVYVLPDAASDTVPEILMVTMPLEYDFVADAQS